MILQVKWGCHTKVWSLVAVEATQLNQAPWVGWRVHGLVGELPLPHIKYDWVVYIYVYVYVYIYMVYTLQCWDVCGG